MTNTTKQITDIDWDIVEGSNQDYTDVYPRIQWHHGKRQFQKVGGMVFKGGLFVPDDQFPNFNADGWVKDSFTSSQNEDIKGNYAETARLAIIRVKKFWDDKGSHVHAICCIDGIDGIFALQVGGISKGQPFMNLFTAHRNQIVAVANRSKPDGKPSLEPYALWCVVTAEPHSQQISKVKSGEGSEVTRPTLYTPEEVTLDYVRSLWVGSDNYKRFTQIYKETELWQSQVPKPQVEADTPSYTGSQPSDRITQAQIEHLMGMCEAKGLDIKELALTATDGATNDITTLTKDEASEIIQTAQAY